jgi:serine/threonine protein phosphatase PrpC
VAALIHQGKLSIANIGDSTAFLISQGGYITELTSEQTPNRMDEYLRICQNGGKVIQQGNSLRVEGALAVTRSIGDKEFKNVLSSEPETLTVQLKNQD